MGQKLSKTLGRGETATVSARVFTQLRRWVKSPVVLLGAFAVLLSTSILVSCGGGEDTSTSDSSVRLAPAAIEAAKAIDMKVLVISATGTQPSYNAVTAILDQIGVPHDRFVLQGPNKTTTPFALSDGLGKGKYQGIILETGDLPYEKTPGYYPSAMTDAQWQMLWQYQRDFGVRTATLYTRPAQTLTDDGVVIDLTYGLTPVSGRNTNNYTDTWVPNVAPPVTAAFTAEGSQVFNYLNSANPVSIVNAYTYFATPAVGANVTPLLQTNVEPGGPFTIASVFTAADGRQNLAITADSNENLTHALLTGYGVVNWVTKGLFMGQRKVYLSAQPDDFFIADTVWNAGSPDPACLNESEANPCPDYRMSGTDYSRLVAWQTELRSRPLTGDIRLEMPFNGYGYNQGYTGDLRNTLLPAVKANPGAFRWINHTWDHTSLNLEDRDDPENVPQSLEQMLNQFQLNDSLAKGLVEPGLSFSLYHKEAMVTPVYSGLENDTFWDAAQRFGFRHLVMDTSRTYDFRPTLGPIPTNTGFYSARDVFMPANPRIFIIPRYPTNLFYNVTTPTEWVSEFNYLYGVTNPYFPPPPGWSSWFGKDLTYPELLDIESDTLVRYMLRFNANSWMFHQANLRAYDKKTNASLLADLLDAITNKYRAMYNLPVVSPSQVEIGQLMQARMAYNEAIAAGLKGRIVLGATGNTIELSNPTAKTVQVPLTGVGFVPEGGQGEMYGSQLLVTLPLAPGATVVLTPPPVVVETDADLGITKQANVTSVRSGGKSTFSLTLTNTGPLAVTNASFSDVLPAGMSKLTKVTVASATAGASASSLVNTGTSLTGLLTLPAGGQLVLRFEVTVTGVKGTSIINSATVSVPTGFTDPVLSNNTATATVTIR